MGALVSDVGEMRREVMVGYVRSECCARLARAARHLRL
jgi:hypothetical protein